MKSLTINSSNKKQIIDITDDIEKLISNESGVVNIFLKHTSAALTTADLDPGTDDDYLKALEKITPELNYTHPHDPSHFSDHFLSSVIGTSINIPLNKGKLDLGTWQRIILIELNGPKTRNLTLSIYSE